MVLRVRKGHSIKVPGKSVYAVRGSRQGSRPLPTGAAGGQRWAQAIGPWVKPRVVFHPEPYPESKATIAAVKRGERIFERQQQLREKRGQQRQMMFEGQSSRKQRVVIGKNGAMHIYPGAYVPYTFGRKDMARQGNRRKFLLKRGQLEKIYPHIVTAGAGVLSIGGKWVVIPFRSKTVAVFPSQYHVVSGTAEIYHHTGKQRQHETPSEVAMRETAEEIGFETPGKIKQFPWFAVEKASKEIGIAKNQFSFYGPGFRKVPKGREAPAMVIVRDLINGTAEPLYAVDIKTNNPDRLLREKFEELPNGMLKVRNAKDAWEMAYAAKVPRNSKSIYAFMEKNKKNLTQVVIVALSVYAQELAKTGH